jgi:hypothetical protein
MAEDSLLVFLRRHVYDFPNQECPIVDRFLCMIISHSQFNKELLLKVSE